MNQVPQRNITTNTEMRSCDKTLIALCFLPLCLEHPSWTYGHEKSLSHSAFRILENHGENFTISFFLRSLKHSGLILQLQREEDPYLTVYLREGTVAIYSPPTTLISEAKHVADGKNNMVTLKMQYGHVVFPKAGHHRALGNVSVEAGDVAYVGGLPAASSMKAWGGNFKGCLQDIRLDDKRLTSEDHLDSDEVYRASEVENVLLGCLSDDTCKVKKYFGFFPLSRFGFVCKEMRAASPIPRPSAGCLAYFFLYTVFTAFDTDLVVKPSKQPVSS